MWIGYSCLPLLYFMVNKVFLRFLGWFCYYIEMVNSVFFFRFLFIFVFYFVLGGSFSVSTDFLGESHGLGR